MFYGETATTVATRGLIGRQTWASKH